MSDLAKLKKKAAELEQRRQFDKALAVYEEMLLAQEGSDDADVSLLNRVGDLRIRLGRGAEALDAYERAVELYVERGFLNNAIALCNKILRQDPRRAEVHYRLGRISAEKGFRSDARRHFLDYAGLMQAAGRLDEAFTALQEFAELSRENGDVRLVLAEQMAKHGRTEDAVAQLTTLHEQYELERRYGEAEEVAERIRALDPSFAAPPHGEGEEPGSVGGDGYRPHATPSRPHTPARTSGGMPDLVLIEPTEFGGGPVREPASGSGSGAESRAEGEETPAGIEFGVPEGSVRDEALEVAGELPVEAAVELVDGLTTTSEGELALDGAPAFVDGLAAPALDGFEATDLAAPELGALDIGTADVHTLDVDAPEAMVSGMDALVDGPLDIEPTSLEVTGFEPTGFEDPGLEGADFGSTDLATMGVEGIGVEDLGVENLEFGSADFDGPGAESPEAGTSVELPYVLDVGASDAGDAPTMEADGHADGLPVLFIPEELRDEEPLALPGDAGALPEYAAELVAPAPAPGERPTRAAPPSPVTGVFGDADAHASASDDDSFINLGDLLRAEEGPRSTRMVTEERAPTGDEQADFAEMLRKFKQGVAENVDEEDYDSHHDLGVAYREMGLLDEAIAEFQRALRGTPHRARTYEALGHCFLEREQYAIATSVLQRALAEPGADDQKLVGVLYLLGRAAEAMNQRNEALSYYQRVFAVDIEFADVARRMDMAVQVTR